MKRFVPLSLVFFLAATTGSAMAGSQLDPYAHIKAPAPTQPVKKKAPAAIPQVEDVEEAKTYVTLKYAEQDPDKKKEGLIGKMIPDKLPGVGGIAAPFKKIGDGIASGAKASGDFAKKGATVVGSGFKSTGDKLKDSTHAVSKVAQRPNKKRTAHQSSIEDIYTREAKRELASADPKKAQNIIKKGSNLEKPESAFLPSAKSAKLGMLNPFNLAKGKKAPPPRPQSGFLDGALNKEGGDIANQPAKKEKQVAAKPAPAAADKSGFDWSAGVPEGEKISQDAPKTSAPKQKKSKFPNLNVAKFKPAMPSLPGRKKGKKQQQHSHPALANEPKSGFSAAAHEKRVEEMQPVAKQPAQSPESSEEFDASIASFPTGDKEIDSAQPKAPATATARALASKPANKKGKLSGITGAMGGMKLPKLGLRKKTTKLPLEPRQTTPKDDPIY